MHYALKALPDGTTIDLCYPGSYTFKVETIAEMLSKIKRFNGYGLDVAKHSLCVARTLYLYTGNPYIALAGLLHDAQEAFVGDVSTPVKAAVGADWGLMEDRLQYALMQQLCPHSEYARSAYKLVKLADTYFLKLEVEALFFTGDYKRNEAWDFLNNITVPTGAYDVIDTLSGTAEAFVKEFNMYKYLIDNIDETLMKQVSFKLPSGEDCICYVDESSASYPINEFI